MKKLNTRQILLSGGVVAAFAYLFATEFMGEPDEDAEVTAVTQQAFTPPSQVNIQSFEQSHKIEVPQVSDAERTLQTLEFDLKKSQLKAAIAENQNKASKAAIEARKEEAEIDRIKAQNEKTREEARVAVLLAEAEQQAKREAKSVAPSQEPTQSFPLHPLVSSPAPVATPTVSRTVELVVNKIASDHATITVNGRLGNVSVGTVFNGIKLLSIAQDRMSIVVSNIIDKKTSTYSLATSNTRRFSNVESFEKQAQNADAKPTPEQIVKGDIQ